MLTREEKFEMDFDDAFYADAPLDEDWNEDGAPFYE
jgi:hypothetical protein